MKIRLSQNTIGLLLCVAMLMVLFPVCLINLTPPISRDALIHHLAIPKLWLNHGGFYEMPWAVYSYYPMNIDLLYLASLHFKNDIAPKFIHFAFGVGTGLLVYAYLKQRLNRNWGLLGLIIFITTPIVIWLSTSAYVDLGMTFFTTGSILCFVKWRDAGYNKLKWLIISSCCMGIALGSKYNALIVWFFLNLTVVYCYARDTQKQLPALKYGLIFLTITSIIASPWYIKNYVLTGNPFYPLFDKFFQLFQHEGGQGSTLGGLMQSSGIGFFQRRQIMYGESFWETLLIPIRMFFQGRDDTYQYFQGVLNPVLILFLPFSLMNKRFRKDNLFFIAFSAFFITMAFFLTAKQVRYTLPVLPFLAILAAMGIENIVTSLGLSMLPPPQSDSKLHSLHPALLYTGLITIVAVAGILLTLNFIYLKNRFAKIQPLRYIQNKESKAEFLSRHLRSYPATEYINNHTTAEAKVFFMFVGRRGYYLDRTYYHDGIFGMKTLNEMVRASQSEYDFLAYLQSLGCTHILVRTSLFNKYLQDNFSRETILRLLGLIRQSWKLLYEFNGWAVYSIGELQQVDT